MYLDNFLRIGESLYKINRVIKDAEGINIDAWKSVTYSDIAFRNSGKIYLCDTVQDAEIIEEINIKTE